MSSFFKKPVWAQTVKSESTEFYRLSDRVYADIVEHDHREVKEHITANEELEKWQSSGKKHSKRRRIAPDTERNDLNHEHTSNKAVLLSVATGENHLPSDGAKGENSEYEHYELISRNDHEKPPVPDKSLQQEVQVAVNKPKGVDSNSAVLQRSLGNQFPRLPDETSVENKSIGFASCENPSNASDPKNSTSRVILAGEKPMLSTVSSKKIVREEPPSHTVRILITSNIKNTEPLIVHRKLHQSLGDVRRAYCNKQGFNDDMVAKTFLTWRGKRLFDVTTCKGLGLETETKRPEPLIGHHVRDDDAINVHMVAMTGEIFQEYRKHRKIWSQEDVELEELEGSVSEREGMFQIIIKSPGFKDFSIQVQQATAISDIIGHFRSWQHISLDKNIHLAFDGEILDPQTCIRDNEIDENDCVDATVK